MTDLSPAAQTVMNATDYPEDWATRIRVAAALRAAADQAVPDERVPSGDSAYHLMNWTKSLDQYYQRQQTRDELLAIADELEAQ